jgi:hypothetical protein
VDREAIARAQRRRQASEALQFERERAADLQELIDMLVVELEGSGVDRQAFAKMTAEDAELARSLLAPEEPADDADEDAWLIFGDDQPEDDQPEGDEPDPRTEAEEEIARLQAEIAASRRREQALEAYIAALDESALRQERA